MTPNHLTKPSDDVYQAPAAICELGTADLELIRQGALVSKRGRCRICAHPGQEDALHEMLVAMRRGSYVPPHRHHRKSESYHLVAGAVDMVIFTDSGTISRVVHLQQGTVETPFYFRLSQERYHMPIVRSDVVIFHETTNGPFRPTDTEFAPWAPPEGSPEAVDFLRRIESATANWTPSE